MTEKAILELASKEGFSAARIIDVKNIPFDHSFRNYCEDNLCGQYGTNYSCPPFCGSPAEMEKRIRVYKKALVLQSKWAIDFRDHEAIRTAKVSHNNAMMRIIEKLRQHGHNSLMCGASCCSLCDPCAASEGNPCNSPHLKFSCLSAYCVYVRKLADFCYMDYNCPDGKVAFFGVYAF